MALGDKNRKVSKEGKIQWSGRGCLVGVRERIAGSLLETKVKGIF